MYNYHDVVGAFTNLFQMRVIVHFPMTIIQLSRISFSGRCGRACGHKNRGMQLPLSLEAGWFVQSTIIASRGLSCLSAYFKMADVLVRLSGLLPGALSQQLRFNLHHAWSHLRTYLLKLSAS